MGTGVGSTVSAWTVGAVCKDNNVLKSARPILSSQTGWLFSFLFLKGQDSNPSVAARMSAAGDGLTEPNHNHRPVVMIL